VPASWCVSAASAIQLEIAGSWRAPWLPGGGPALLFENPRGSRFPLAINVFGSRSVAWRSASAGRARARWPSFSAARRRPDPVGQAQMLPKPRRRSLRKSIGGGAVPGGSRGSCRSDATTDLDLLADDGGPFITLPIVITHDRDARAAACTACDAHDGDALAGAQDRHAPLPQIQERGQKVPVAVVLGGVRRSPTRRRRRCPTASTSSCWPAPAAARGRAGPVQDSRSKCRPTRISCSGYVDPTEPIDEGPFGDHTSTHAARQYRVSSPV
jgi:4-hydroxy-3-polyprenylbenzoate decarboxylase